MSRRAVRGGWLLLSSVRCFRRAFCTSSSFGGGRFASLSRRMSSGCAMGLRGIPGCGLPCRSRWPDRTHHDRRKKAPRDAASPSPAVDRDDSVSLKRSANTFHIAVTVQAPSDRTLPRPRASIKRLDRGVFCHTLFRVAVFGEWSTHFETPRDVPNTPATDLLFPCWQDPFCFWPTYRLTNKYEVK